MSSPTPPDAPRHQQVLVDIAHDGLRDAILGGELAPGEHVTAVDLEARLGTPSTALHDAMTALAAEGLLDRDAHGEFRVIDPDPITVNDTLRTMGVLMGGVAREAVSQLTDDERSRVRAALALAVPLSNAEHVHEHAHANLKFYAALLEVCPNPVLADLVRSSLVSLSYRYLLSIDRRELNWAVIRASRAELDDAIASGDQIRAELAIEALHGLAPRS